MNTLATGPVSGLASLPSGVTLHYVVQGRPDGTPVVLVHGVGDSWRSWELVLPHLPERLRVYAITQRGHGFSDHPPSGYSRQDYAADLRQFIEALDLRDVALVGHSLGSWVVQAAAAADAARVARLVLVGSAPGCPTNPTVVAELIDFFDGVPDPPTPAFGRDFQASTVVQPLPAAFFETVTLDITRVRTPVWKGVAALLGEPAPNPNVRDIRARTLLVWGTHDAMMSRADQDLLLASIAGSRLIVYDDAGHTPHWEHPERFARDLVAFLDEPA